MDKKEWQEFFDGHAPVYMENCFTKATLAEVDFVIAELQLAAGRRILDVGCGAGRHAVELARRGYRVAGLDFSAGMLAEAEKAAREAGVAVEWIQADAVQFALPEQFDAALCLCEGALALLNAGDDPIERDLTILRNIHASLKPGGRFLLTTLNAFRAARAATPEDVAAGRFDALASVSSCEMPVAAPGEQRSVRVRERYYVPTELSLLLRLAGFSVERVGGGTAGRWGRRPLELDEMELMAFARKPA